SRPDRSRRPTRTDPSQSWLRDFLTRARAEVLAGGGVVERLLELGLRAPRRVGATKVLDRRLDLVEQLTELRRQLGGALQERGGIVGGEGVLRLGLKGLVARLQLVGGRVELLLELVRRGEVGLAQILQLADEGVRRGLRVVELLLQRVLRQRAAGHVRE